MKARQSVGEASKKEKGTKKGHQFKTTGREEAA